MESSLAARPPPATVDAENARRVLSFARSRGLSKSPPELAIPAGGARIPARQMFAIWARVTRELDAPSLPITFAANFRMEQLGLLGFAVMTAPTLRESLETFARYDALLNDGRAWALRSEGDELTLACFTAAPLALGTRLSCETMFAQMVAGMRELGGAAGQPLRVSFRHRAPRDLRAHRELFRCELVFDAPAYGVTFERAGGDAHPPLANRALWSHLVGQAELERARLAPRSLRERVEIEALQLIEAERTPSMSAIARTLGMSERSLRRALEREGVGFRELLDRARMHTAERLLKRGGRSLSAIALSCGYADASAFSHACRRWFGASPRSLSKRELD